MKKVNFRVRAKLKTPMKIGQYPVSLDGLLWHCLFLKTGCESSASKKLAEIIDSKSGVFKASALRFGIYPSKPVIARTESITGSMRQETDLAPDQFYMNKRGGKYPRITQEGGPYKARLEHHKMHHAPEVTWDAVGDPIEACKLLNFYVHAVGVNSNRGMGSVGTFWFEKIDSDTSWVDEENQLARVLPIKLFEECGGDKKVLFMEVNSAQKAPPHRKIKAEQCAIPARVRRIRLQEPIN